MQNIGSAQSDADTLLDAAGSPRIIPSVNGVRRRVGDAGMPAVVTGPPGLGPIIAAGVGLGAALLFIHNDPQRAGSVGKIGTVPKIALVGGGLAALYFLLRAKPVPTAIAPGTAPVQSTNPILQTPSQQTASTEGNQQRKQLLAIYAGKPNDVAAVNAVSDDVIRKWSLLMNIWQQGGDGYKFDLNGNPSTNYDGSLGKWYEGLAAQYNLT